MADPLTRLKSEEPAEREDALLELLDRDLAGNAEAAEALEERVLAEEELPALRIGALRGLLDADVERGFKWLFTVLRQTDLDPELRWRAVGVFAQLEFPDAERSERQRQDLLEYTRDDAPLVRLHAAANLARLDSSYDQGVVLVDLAGHEDEGVRVEVAKAFGVSPAPPSAEAAAAIRRLAQEDPSDAVRSIAAVAFASLPEG